MLKKSHLLNSTLEMIHSSNSYGHAKLKDFAGMIHRPLGKFI